MGDKQQVMLKKSRHSWNSFQSVQAFFSGEIDPRHHQIQERERESKEIRVTIINLVTSLTSITLVIINLGESKQRRHHHPTGANDCVWSLNPSCDALA